MTRVLIIAGTVPQQQATLNERLTQLRELGATTAIVTNFDPELLTLDGDVAQVHALRNPGGYSTRLHRSLGAAPAPRRVWLLLKENRGVRRLAAQADVLVALDSTAIHAVWELAQRHRRPAAVHGVEPALRAVERHLTDPGGAARGPLSSAPAWGGVALRATRQASMTTAASVLRAAVSPPVMRTRLGTGFWSAVVAAPKLPDKIRRRVALSVHNNMLKAELPTTAVAASTKAAAKIHDRHLRADLLIRQAYQELSYGPPASMGAAVTAGLTVADNHLTRKEPRKVAPVVDRVMKLLFDRRLHFDRLSSPLAEDPDGYLAQWRTHEATRALWVPRGRAATAIAPAGRGLRLLIITDGTGGLPGEADTNLLADIRRRYEDRPDVDTRFIDVSEHQDLADLAKGSRLIIDHVHGDRSVYGNQVEVALRPHLDWADTVFIDGCQAVAAMFTLIDPGTTRIVCRLHGFEPYTFWPQLVDFSRIDDLVFVSEHARDFTLRVLPTLGNPSSPRLHTITHAMRLRGLDLPKPESARFTLGQIGVGGVAKDPRWAIEVLRLLRERDHRYRLLYFGEPMEPEVSPDVAAYEDAWSRDIAALGGAVHRHGPVGDLAKVLTDIGVMVNGSVRESFPILIAAGAASGSVPVVRDWPFTAGGEHGAPTTVPAEWVVDSPAEAAERIAKVTESPDIWRDAGRAASAYAIDIWDWTRVAADFDRVVLEPSR